MLGGSKLWDTFLSCQSHTLFILFPALYYKSLDKYDLYYFIQHVLLSMTAEICLLLASTLTVWHSKTRSRGDKWTHRRFLLNIRKHFQGNQALAEVTQTDCVSLWDTHKSSGCGMALGDPSWTGGLDQRIPRDQPQPLCSSVASTHLWAHLPDVCWCYPVVPWWINLYCWYMAP